MRYLGIVGILFCIHVSIALVNGFGVLHNYATPATEWLYSVDQKQLASQDYVQGQVSTNVAFGLGDFVKGLYYFVLAVGGGIIWIPATFQALGLPASFAVLLSLPIYFIYFVALGQFIAGRGTKSMD